MERRSWLAAIGLAWGGCAHAPPPVEKPPFAFAVVKLGGREAENGCVMALLDGGFRVVGREAIDAALQNPDAAGYKRLGAALQADLIIDIDGGLAHEKHNRKKRAAVLVSVASGDVLAMTPVPVPGKMSFATGQKVCADLLQQLP